jgi:hypothetical protein
MPSTLTLRDETAAGDVTGTRTLDFPGETITVRELITRRVQEEVREWNRSRTGAWAGLVRPADAVATPGGIRIAADRELDWQAQAEAALTAFESNGFFVLVGDRQVESLDERIRLELETAVSFVRLVPLVGG